MAQVFPKSMNVIARTAALAGPVIFGTILVTGAAFFRSDYTTGAGAVIEQPVPFSHKHHVSELGIHCLYCHTSVEKSANAGLPPTKTCMNCHQQIWQGAELLDPVRNSYHNDTPIAWNKVHNLPHYTYFNHSIHVSKGVGCYSCHGPIDEMNLVYQQNTLLMEWCLNCHREPEKHLRPKDEIFNMDWKPSDETNPDTGEPETQLSLGKRLKEEYMVREPSVITNCSMCHR